MGSRCGCASSNCSCQIIGSPTVQVTGDGSNTNPYKIESLQDLTFTVVDSGSVDLTLTGSGTIDDPAVLSAVATLTIPSVSVTTFSASGTWNRPTGKSIARVTVIGAGGGGGSGRRGAAATNRAGGGGGGGGGYSCHDFFITDLAATVAVTVGAGGSGGAAATVNSTDGSAGTNGGATTFGTLLVAQGGLLGGQGTTALVGSANWGIGGLGMESGGRGGGETQSAPSIYSHAASGGGLGGYINSSDAASNGTGGGANLAFGMAGGTGGAVGAAGAAGAVGLYTTISGTGGGGGGFGISVAAGAGGAGARGGGGGGGGASTNGFNSGAGGAGGDGYCSVAVW